MFASLCSLEGILLRSGIRDRCRAGQSRAGQRRAEESNAKQGKAKHSKAKQRNAKQFKATQHKAKQANKTRLPTSCNTSGTIVEHDCFKSDRDALKALSICGQLLANIIQDMI